MSSRLGNRVPEDPVNSHLNCAASRAILPAAASLIGLKRRVVTYGYDGGALDRASAKAPWKVVALCAACFLHDIYEPHIKDQYALSQIRRRFRFLSFAARHRVGGGLCEERRPYAGRLRDVGPEQRNRAQA